MEAAPMRGGGVPLLEDAARVKDLAFGGGTPEARRATPTGEIARPDVWVERPGGGWAVEVQHSQMDTDLAVRRMRRHRDSGAFGTLWVLDAVAAGTHADWRAWVHERNHLPTATWVRGRLVCPVSGSRARAVIQACRVLRDAGYRAAVAIIRQQPETGEHAARLIAGGSEADAWGHGAAYLVRRYGQPLTAASWRAWSGGVDDATGQAIDTALVRPIVDADRWYEIEVARRGMWLAISCTSHRPPSRGLLSAMRQAGLSTRPSPCRCRRCGLASTGGGSPPHAHAYWGQQSEAAFRLLRREFGWRPEALTGLTLRSGDDAA